MTTEDLKTIFCEHQDSELLDQPAIPPGSVKWVVIH